jgi:transcriptional regulator with XRE-family HTH domain
MSSNESRPPEVTGIGGRLRRLRKERNLTQAELARQIGIQQSDLSRMEKGEYRVSLDNLFKILRAFDVQASEFFAGEPQRAEAAQQPLSRDDMQILHLLRELDLEARQEVLEYLEFKVRRQRSDRRAVAVRKPQEQGS